MKLMTKLLAATALLAATQANAAPVVIDFASAAWVGANNQTDFKVGIATATAGPAGATLWVDSTDGMGVRGFKEIDEIDRQEYLEVTFDQVVTLDSILLTDFFDKDKDGGDGSTLFGEKGYLSLWLDGAEIVGSPLEFFGINSDQVNGTQTISGGYVKVDMIKFYTTGINDDFSVNLIKYDVPESGMAVLLSLGLMGLGLSRRRQAKKA